jgi:hypothetical protein
MDKSDQKQWHTDLDTRLAHDGLDVAHVEALARRVVELLRTETRENAGIRLVDASTLAADLGVERSWVYEHANELHPIRLGTGPKARLRFDALAVRAAFAAQNLTRRPSPLGGERTNGRTPARRPRQRRPQKPTVGRVLAVRPRDPS